MITNHEKQLRKGIKEESHRQAALSVKARRIRRDRARLVEQNRLQNEGEDSAVILNQLFSTVEDAMEWDEL